MAGSEARVKDARGRGTQTPRMHMRMTHQSLREKIEFHADAMSTSTVVVFHFLLLRGRAFINLKIMARQQLVLA